MGLSRLENFIKNVRGNILYVSPNDLDSTDSIENSGNSLTRPFKTIQRALVEASRFSYQKGLNNDRFNQTTILVYPGEHIIDNRPGYIPDGLGTFKTRGGFNTEDFTAWDGNTVYDLNTENNALYKLNSVHGGVIVPRGVSIIGIDLRKTKIRPKYIPNPTDSNIPSSAVFRLTGGSYVQNFTILDGDPNSTSYRDYLNSDFIPNFSHHKLTCFEYVDGTNNVKISDTFLTYESTRTDLDMYYEKVGLVYGTASGREIQPDYPSTGLDIESKVDEYRLVGPTGQSVEISAIQAGNGVVATTTITVTTATAIDGLDVDNVIVIDGLADTEYNGRYTVTEKINSTQFKYITNNPPVDPLPSSTATATASIVVDNITSASPYINTITLKSVYGMCGVLADGSKSSGFKSIVISEFSGISLQKDENAFVKFNKTSGVYEDTTIPGNENLSSDIDAVYKPAYSNFHIKGTGDTYIQAVSCFAIGFSEQFVSIDGANLSLSNCNSNFGAKSLSSSGFKNTATSTEDLGYISHILPPREVDEDEISVSFAPIDIKTTIGIGTTNERLYLYDQKNVDSLPSNEFNGYKIGAKASDKLYILTSNGEQKVEHFSRIVMPNSQSSSEKVFNVLKTNVGINSIVSNTITLTENHTFQNAESVRVISEDGSLPDGIESNTVYYAITSGVDPDEIKLASSEANARTLSAISFNNFGGSLKIVSRVSDKKSGDVGHPIQYDTGSSQWYIKVATANTENLIHSNVIVGLGTTAFNNDASPKTYVKRTPDNRQLKDSIYRLRYVIPEVGTTVAKPPSIGAVIQESSTSIGSTAIEVGKYFGSGTLTNSNQLRNFKIISDVSWDTELAHFTTEVPHKLNVGSQVQINNVKSTLNVAGAGNSGFNRTYSVVGVGSAKEFSVGLSTDPGSFTSDITVRDTNLPNFSRKRYRNTYYVQNVEEVQEYISGVQPGVYYLTVLNSTNSPSISPFTGESFSQPIQNLYPEIDRDNLLSDINATISVASPSPIGKVTVDDSKNSITRETSDKFISDINIGVGLTDILTNVVGTGGTIHELRTKIDHGLNGAIKVSIASSGANYGTGSASEVIYYGAKLVASASSTGPTGKHASARVTVDANDGGITEVLITDGGSGYFPGNQCKIVSVATTTGHSAAEVVIEKVNDNVGDVVKIVGVSSDTYEPYNTLYRITSVGIGSEKDFRAESISEISGVTTTGIGATVLSNAVLYNVGKSVGISSINYFSSTGIATVTTNSNHGFGVNNKVRIVTGIATMPEFDGEFIIKKDESLTSFSFNLGIGVTDQPVAMGSSMFVLPTGWTSNAGTLGEKDSSVNARMVSNYAGITTTLSSGIANATTDEVSLTNVGDLNLAAGDYLSIDNEIVRIKTNPSNPLSNPLLVFRGVLGSKATSHDSGSIVRKIQPLPIEFRTPSKNVAQSHVWEHVGFGPGNYSTGLPSNQTRGKTPEEEILSQSYKKDGGLNFFDGIDNEGSSYFGNKKINNISGEEEVFDGPNLNSETVINTKSTTFEGKLTSTSDEGVEAKNILLKGNVDLAKKHTVEKEAPSYTGNPGDIVYSDLPIEGQNSAWIYANDKSWKRTGPIALSADTDSYLFSSVGIGTTTLSLNDHIVQIGSGSSIVTIGPNGSVGVGSTGNIFKFRVEGTSHFSGSVSAGDAITASSFIGDGSGLTNLNVSATGWAQVEAGLGTGIYNTQLNRVGINTAAPQVVLDVGSPTSGVGGTDLRVRNIAKFDSSIVAQNISVGGILTSTNYRLDSTLSRIRSGIVTTSTLVVGTAGTVITTNSSQNIGIGTLAARTKLDVEGRLRTKSHSENIEVVSVSAGNVNIDLNKATIFDLDLSTSGTDVTQFTLLGTPDSAASSEFVIRIKSNGSNSVGINTFKNQSGTNLRVYWPSSVPNVSISTDKYDFYRFRTFSRSGAIDVFGFVDGQNMGYQY